MRSFVPRNILINSTSMRSSGHARETRMGEQSHKKFWEENLMRIHHLVHHIEWILEKYCEDMNCRR